jgi:hypothetical protein
MADSAGARLARTIRGCLPPGVELDEREEALLSAAARQADDVEALEADVRERGYVLESGRLNPSVGESRQGRLALGRLLGGLDLPDSRSFAEIRATKAARGRWDRRSA